MSFMKPNYPTTRFSEFKPIGRGGFGIVYSALDSNGTRVAIKEVTIPEASKRNEDYLRKMLREIRLLKHLNHPSFIRPLEFFVSEDEKSLYIVTELYDQNMGEKVKDSKQTITHEEAKHYLYKILLGVYYIHSATILHRDLKPHNALLAKKPEEQQETLKICDLGLARCMGDDFHNDPLMTHFKQCTIWYRAPEMLLKCQVGLPGIDMWSVGCILGELLTRKAMFPGASDDKNSELRQLEYMVSKWGVPNNHDFQKMIPNFSIPSDLAQVPQEPIVFPADTPKEALDLLKKLLVYNPYNRISAEDALKHPWFNDIHNPKDLIKCPEYPFDEKGLSAKEIHGMLKM